MLTIANSASVITWGSPVTITILVDRLGANKVVDLQRSFDGSQWTALASLTTNASGMATLTWRPATNLFYRATLTVASDLPPLTSNTSRTIVRQVSILRPTNRGLMRSVTPGTVVSFVNTVRPARPALMHATVRFVFYRREAGGGWVRFAVRDVQINPSGQASTRWTFAPGEWYVRSQARPTPDNANSVWGPIERYRVQ
jgi:hypothetical protein